MTSSREPSYPIYGVEAIRALEAQAPRDAHPALMERAGRAAADLAEALLGAHTPARVLVLAGPGNNGGDGFVLARHLHRAGHRVTVVFAADPERLPADAHEAHGAWLDAGGTTLAELPGGDWDLAVDALFGIGLARPIAAPYAEWIARFNALPCARLALDIPSGLDADRGGVPGPCVRASETITFIAAKPGLLTRDGPDHTGRLHVAAIGLDPAAMAPPPGWTVSPARFAAHLHARARNSHKGSYGDAGIVGGAAGMVGAALLAARAALHLGAGRVFVGLLAPGAPALDAAQPELMLRAPSAVTELAGALALGPGLGVSETALALLERALAGERALLLDADALNLLAAHPVALRRLARRSAPTALTPHPAEAARLLGSDTASVQADRVSSARELARRCNAHVVLKGCGSVIAAPAGGYLINTTGNPGLASAGSGDVLSGMIVALLAQGWSIEAALAGAVWLHGCAAERAVAAGDGPIGLTAGELARHARAALNALVAHADGEVCAP